MVESTTSQEIALDSPEVSLVAYKSARAEGKTSVSKEDLADAKPSEPTGDESLEEYKKKRDEQRPNNGKGVQKRIDRLTKHNATLETELVAARTRLQELAGTTESPAKSERTQETAEPAERTKQVNELRQRYQDFDAVMAQAKSENMRISDDAAKVMHASPQAGHIAYILAKNPAFRNELNKLTPAQQISEIRRMEAQITHGENGKEFSARVRSELSPQELAELQRGIEANPRAADVVLPFMRELNALPHGVDLLKVIVRDKELSQRLAGMSQTAAAIELGRLSAQFKPVSRAPEPVRPIRGGTAKSSVPLDEMNLADYKKARAAGRVR